MLIIINGDDFGASKEINDAIFQLVSAKLISSSTILANGPAVEEAVKKAKKLTGCSFGFHLNATEYSPLTSNTALKAILDERGNFMGNQKLREIAMTPSLSDALYKEFCAQIEKLLSLGIRISHIDSHEHIHTMPRIFLILKRVQKKYGIRKVRISRNIYSPGYHIPRILLFEKRFYNFMLRYYYSTRTTAGFCNFIQFYENATLNNLKHKSIEIMVHPEIEEVGNAGGYHNPLWCEELPVSIELINYNQL